METNDQSIPDFSKCHTHDEFEKFTANYNKLMSDLQNRKQEFKNPIDVDRFDNDIFGRNLYIEWIRLKKLFNEKYKDVEFIGDLIKMFEDFHHGYDSRSSAGKETTFKCECDDYLEEYGECNYESDGTEYMKCDYPVIKQSKRSYWLNRQYINKTKIGHLIVSVQLLFDYLYFVFVVNPLWYLFNSIDKLRDYVDEKKCKKSIDK